MRLFDAPICRGRWTRAVFLVLACVAPWLTVAAQPAPCGWSSTAWPPFTNAPRQPRFALDLVEDALRRINLTARTTIVSARNSRRPCSPACSMAAGGVDPSASVG